MGGWTHGSEDSKPRLDTGVLDLRSGAWHDAEVSAVMNFISIISMWQADEWAYRFGKSWTFCYKK